jgi:hypothetical protein
MMATPVLYLVPFLDDESDKLVSAATVEKPDVPATCHHAIGAVLKALSVFIDRAKERAYL